MPAQPRPYIVRCRDRDGGEHVKNVLAYDLQEAMLTASIEIAADGPEVAKILSVEPDIEAIRAGIDEDAERGLRWARAIGQNVGEQ